MKKVKKFVSLLLSITVMLSMLCTFAAIQVAAQGLSLAQLQAKFPNGAYWNHGSGPNNPDGYTWTPCNHHNSNPWNCPTSGSCGCNSFAGGIQCWGFAQKLAYDVYGSYYTSWPFATNLNNVKPGDVIRYSGHSIFVTGVSGDTITLGDCNYGWNFTCRIRWNATITKSAILSAGLEKIYFAPYQLDGGSTQSPTVTIATDYEKYGVSDTNACVCAYINNPAGKTIGTLGCYLYGETGDLLLRHEEQCNPNYVHNTRVPMWTDFWFDAGFGLQPGTTYQYVLYAYVDGVEYKSDRGTFKTIGEKTFKATATVSKKTICAGESVTLRVDAPNANGYHLGIWKDGVRVVDDRNSNATVTYTPTAPGDYYAYFTARNSAGQTADSNKVYWTVKSDVSAITLAPNSLVMSVGDTETVKARVVPASAADMALNWTSSEPTVATVSSSGVVTAVSSGNATITVRAANGVSASLPVSVSDYHGTVSASLVTGRRGQMVTVQLAFSSDIDMHTFQSDIQYDPSVLEFLVARYPLVADYPELDGAFSFNETLATDKMRFLFSPISSPQLTGGVMLEMDFKIKSDAPLGMSPIRLSNALMLNSASFAPVIKIKTELLDGGVVVLDEVQYTIVYDANGGSQAPEAQEKGVDEDIRLTRNVPTRPGYEFMGWADTPHTTTVLYVPGAYYTKNANITLYAVWRRAAVFGDINNDGAVTAQDALLALQCATHKITMDESARQAADVDGDQDVTASDALFILQAATGKIEL